MLLALANGMMLSILLAANSVMNIETNIDVQILMRMKIGTGTDRQLS